jgi:hypothetical protein
MAATGRRRWLRAVGLSALVAWGSYCLYGSIAANLCDESYGCPHGHLGMWWRIMLATSGILLALSGVIRLVNMRESAHRKTLVKAARALLIVSVAAFVVWIDLHYQVTNQTGP